MSTNLAAIGVIDLTNPIGIGLVIFFAVVAGMCLFYSRDRVPRTDDRECERERSD